MFTIISALVLASASAAPSHAKTPEPKGSVEGLFSADDYPTEALDKNEQGSVTTLIRVDATGAVSDCLVEKSSGSAILDQKTCNVIRERAKFKPALDGKGRPVASELHKTIAWRIGEDWAPSEPWANRVVVNFDADGRPISCRFEFEGAMKPAETSATPACSLEMVPQKLVADLGRLNGAIDQAILETRFVVDPAAPSDDSRNDVLTSRTAVSLDIDATGKLTGCKVADTSGLQLSADACSVVRKQYFPRKGPDGKPAPFDATEIFNVFVHFDRSRARQACNARDDGGSDPGCGALE